MESAIISTNLEGNIIINYMQILSLMIVEKRKRELKKVYREMEPGVNMGEPKSNLEKCNSVVNESHNIVISRRL